MKLNLELIFYYWVDLELFFIIVLGVWVGMKKIRDK